MAGRRNAVRQAEGAFTEHRNGMEQRRASVCNPRQQKIEGIEKRSSRGQQQEASAH